MLLAIGTWVRSLLVVAVLGNLAEFLLPEGTFRRYAGLVVGLVLLAAILAPLRSFLSGTTPMPEITWQNPSGTTSYQQLLNGEEVRSAEAVLDNYPGVTRAQVTLSGNRATVTVWAQKPLGQDFTAYAQAAVEAVATSSVTVQVKVVSGSARASG